MKAKSKNLFVHFHRREHPFVERCLDWKQQVIDRYQEVITPFLTPREQEILTQLMKNEPALMFRVDGGLEEAERCRMQLGLAEMIEFQSPIPIAFLRIVSHSGKRLKHQQVLGSILGLGVDRNQIGDLYPHAAGCDLVVAEEMSDYIQFHLERVGREKVRVEEISRDQLIREEPVIQIRKVLLSSLRLDTVVSGGFQVSRKKAANFIRTEKCSVNWKIEDNPSAQVEEGSLLSLRGHGRIRLIAVEKETKKGKFFVRFGVFQEPD